MKKLNILALTAILSLLATKHVFSMQDDIRNFGDFQDEQFVRAPIDAKIDNLMYGQETETIVQEKITSIINIIKETKNANLMMLDNMGFDFDYIELANAQLLIEDKSNNTNNALSKEVANRRQIIIEEEKFVEKIAKNEDEKIKDEQQRISGKLLDRLIREETIEECEDEDNDIEMQEAKEEINEKDVAIVKSIIKAIKNPNDKNISRIEWQEINQKLSRTKIEIVNLQALIEKFGKTATTKALLDFIEENGDESLPKKIENDPKYIELLENF